MLLDQARYARVAAEAERTGRSVAAVIRGAIDLALPDGDQLRIEVASELLRSTAHPEAKTGVGPAELKAAIAYELTSTLDAL